MDQERNGCDANQGCDTQSLLGHFITGVLLLLNFGTVVILMVRYLQTISFVKRCCGTLCRRRRAPLVHPLNGHDEGVQTGLDELEEKCSDDGGVTRQPGHEAFGTASVTPIHEDGGMAMTGVPKGEGCSVDTGAAGAWRRNQKVSHVHQCRSSPSQKGDEGLGSKSCREG